MGGAAVAFGHAATGQNQFIGKNIMSRSAPNSVNARRVVVMAAALFSAPLAAAITNPQASNDATRVYYSYAYSGTPAFKRVYIDVDRSAGTGFKVGSIGANFLLENGNLYEHDGGGWNWDFIKTVNFSDTNGVARWTVLRADIGETATPNNADLLFQTEAPLETSAKYTHVYSGTTTVSYTADNSLFANPERGFYHHTGDCDKFLFDAATLQSYRTNEGISLVMCMFYLDGFQSSPIDQAALDRLQAQFNTVRSAGMKMILRMAYTASISGNDAALSQVLAHLDQLAPFLQRNSDVINVVQAGMIGAWGEWYYTQNFGNAGNISSTDWINRKTVADKLLSVLPASRMLQVRTPTIKRTMYGTTALTAAQAYNGSANARIGHHNDCFLASATDFGTYQDTAIEYPYLAAETQYLPMGGETCAVNPPRSECASALTELAKFHWSYLNADYNMDVTNSWQAGGCLTEIKRRIGYRFALKSGAYPTTAKRGGLLTFNLSLQNLGWAAPFNARNVEMMLRNTSTGALYRFPLQLDPRLWLAGATTTFSHNLTLPTSMPAGNYALLLNLPDPAPSLANLPAYSLRLANSGVWETSTGFNTLLHMVAVTP